MVRDANQAFYICDLMERGKWPMPMAEKLMEAFIKTAANKRVRKWDLALFCSLQLIGQNKVISL